MFNILHLHLFLTPMVARQSHWPNLCHSTRRLSNLNQYSTHVKCTAIEHIEHQESRSKVF